jgi:phosphoribosyl 1,2-cyclic phosphodiesterase
VRVRLLGVRGSIPVADPSVARYGGNTSCVELTLGDGSVVILDAGTGIRGLGQELAGRGEPVHILLTHLHLDHIQGLMFFAPFFEPGREVTVWGPPSTDGPLRERLARYLSAPVAPIEIRDLPARVTFRSCSGGPWRLGSATVEAALVNHRGHTLGYRISDGGTTLCYLPDHEPALGQSLEDSASEWISGFRLARGASLLIHDGQYADDEYPAHLGWGHCGLSDALRFALRTEVRQLLLFHHDPEHDDARLDALESEARARWASLGGDGSQVELATEQRAYDIAS